MPRLAIMVLVGSEVQDGTRCDAEPKRQDLLHQSETHYSPAHVPGEEEEEEKTPLFTGCKPLSCSLKGSFGACHHFLGRSQ